MRIPIKDHCVNKIGLRSSSISTFDGAEVIVPNNNLISIEKATLNNNIGEYHPTENIPLEANTEPVLPNNSDVIQTVVPIAVDQTPLDSNTFANLLSETVPQQYTN